MLMTWEMINQKCQIKTIHDVQEDVGFIKNRENGIIEQAIQQTEISELLMPYARKADFVLTFQLGYRSILNMFVDNGQILTDNIITAITMALDSNAYNLETILGTLDLDYNPIENMSITEQIVTTSTINANMMYDKISTSKNISEIQKTDTDTFNGGSRNLTDNQTQNLGKIDRNLNTTYNKGEQENTKSDTLTHAPFNVNNYTAYDKTDTNETLGSSKDTETTNDITQNVKNATVTSTSYSAYTDTRTIGSVQKPYDENTTINARNDKQDRKQNDNKNRTLKGVQGSSAQDLILKQREIANVNVVKCICNIVLNVIGNGFITAY